MSNMSDARNIAINESKTKMTRMSNHFASLAELPKVTVTFENGRKVIWIEHQNVYVPMFKAVWCDSKEHYRIYIYIASTETKGEKVLAGYPICVVGSRMKASMFCVLYNFLQSNRGMDKRDSFQSN